MALRDFLTDCWPLASNSLANSESGRPALSTAGSPAPAYVSGSPGPAWQYGTSSQFKLDGIAPPTKFALAVWWRSSGSLSSGGTLASIALADSHYYQLLAATAGFQMTARSRAGGAVNDVQDSGNGSSTQWNLTVMLVDLTTGSENIRIWQNGTMSSPVTITAVPAGSGNKLGFGVIRRDSDGGFIDGVYTKYLAMFAGGFPSDAELDSWYADPTVILPGSPPVVSSANGVPTGPTQATVSAVVDTSGVNLSYLILPAASAAPADAATLIANPSAVSNAVTATGLQSYAVTGLTTDTPVKVHFAQPGGNVASSVSFTPQTLAIAATALSAQTVAQGSALVWTGPTPESLVSNTGNGNGGWSVTGGVGASGVTGCNPLTGVVTLASGGTPGSYTLTLTRVDGSTVPGPQSVTKTVNLTVGAVSGVTISAAMDPFIGNINLSQTPGVINFPPLKNGSGFTWVRGDITAVVQDRATRATVVTLTNVVSTAIGGQLSSTAIAQGGQYRVAFSIPPGGALPNGAKGEADLNGV